MAAARVWSDGEYMNICDREAGRLCDQEESQSQVASTAQRINILKSRLAVQL